jgi:hypothetical protein
MGRARASWLAVVFANLTAVHSLTVVEIMLLLSPLPARAISDLLSHSQQTMRALVLWVGALSWPLYRWL